MSQAHFSDPNFVESVRATHPLGFGRPEDVAEAVEFLSSDRAVGSQGRKLLLMVVERSFTSARGQNRVEVMNLFFASKTPKQSRAALEELLFFNPRQFRCGMASSIR